MAQQALGIAGAAVGAYFGAMVGMPQLGAQLGYALGSAIGGMVDPQVLRGPPLGKAPVQTGRDGVVIPYGWGVVHTAGNILEKNPIQEVDEEVGGGKGSGTKQVQTRRLRTFAIGVIEGPIRGILRIWQNDKLVYDARPIPEIPRADSEAYLENLTIYLGDDEQLPDPELEIHHGVGTTPAHRGLAYIVWNNFDITDFGSAIPWFRFEVQVHGPEIVTSQPYNVEAGDRFQVEIQDPAGAMMPIPRDWIGLSAGFGGVEWEQIRFEIDADPDWIGLSAGFGGVEWDSIREILFADPDWIGISAGFGGVEWDRVRVDMDMVPEKLQIGISAPSGSMTPV